jgi:hypothetical protein
MEDGHSKLNSSFVHYEGLPGAGAYAASLNWLVFGSCVLWQ